MLPFFSLLILALAVSLDGFGVGMMYGLRKIRIPLPSLAIISLCSGIIIYISMSFGVWLSRYLSPHYAGMLGAVILMGIGIWALVQFLAQKQGNDGDGDEKERTQAENGKAMVTATAGTSRLEAVFQSNPVAARRPEAPRAEPEREPRMFSIEIKRLGLVIQILRTPSAADVDRSGNISSSEATLLGIALSLDAFGAGIGAALIGYTPLLTSAVIAVTSGLFIYFGLKIGYQYSGLGWIRKVSVLPGVVLILMGISKLF
ncbi:sporulation membrane protein YtaF [Paenibacillus chitinolyticus]|uniref:MntP/YtaF family protein n=1 Tax=Paenibacillus chitinolyticus TaxID=79263 RepID=UPI0026E4C41A|nr:MntP/YtaF family protein [Paenibacillus chitinolyticus]GKS09179.1 sporulation membrane protein YtaF [Paenibacillus chitinolyticus]